jgi:hypothetical protein
MSSLPHRIGVVLGCVAAFSFVAATEPPARKYTSVERLAPARLKAVHEDVQNVLAQRAAVALLPGLNDYRCILHAHAEDSAHTGGTLPEMLADAKQAGVNAILLSDHFRPPRDFIDGRWRGLKDGVLFIPGSEIRGFLIHPTASILDKMEQPTPEFMQTVAAGDGLIFLSHIEERPEHPVDGLTGLEIYNRHWDAKKDKLSLLALALKLTDPQGLAELQESVRLYPDEALASQCDYPAPYLEKWDAGTKIKRLTGVAANDCHHNTILIVKMADAETVLVGTNVDPDADLRKLTAAVRPGIKEMTKGHQPGDLLARVDLDPYFRSFRDVCTHVLAPTLDEPAIRNALKTGHAFVAHDWMCDASGFRFEAQAADGAGVAIMGDEVKLVAGLKVTAKLPVAAYVRLLRHGEEVAKLESGAEFSFAVKEAGAYRLEAWLRLDNEMRPWIFSNPIYVR